MFLTCSIKDFAKSLKTRNLVLVFGDQLDSGSAAFDDFDTGKDAVLMMQVKEEATYIPPHKI